MSIYFSSCGALEAVLLLPGTGAVCAGPVALGRQAALALWRARQVLRGRHEDAVRLAALSFARTANEYRSKSNILTVFLEIQKEARIKKCETFETIVRCFSGSILINVLIKFSQLPFILL